MNTNARAGDLRSPSECLARSNALELLPPTDGNFKSPAHASRRQFLGALGATAAGLALPARAASPPLASCFVIGDTHFFADKTQPDQMDPTSVAYTSRLVDTLNRLPGTELPAEIGRAHV